MENIEEQLIKEGWVKDGENLFGKTFHLYDKHQKLIGERDYDNEWILINEVKCERYENATIITCIDFKVVYTQIGNIIARYRYKNDAIRSRVLLQSDIFIEDNQMTIEDKFKKVFNFLNNKDKNVDDRENENYDEENNDEGDKDEVLEEEDIIDDSNNENEIFDEDYNAIVLIDEEYSPKGELVSGYDAFAINNSQQRSLTLFDCLYIGLGKRTIKEEH